MSSSFPETTFVFAPLPALGGSTGEVRFVRPVMGQQRPDRTRHLVRQCYDDDVRWAAADEPKLPCRGQLPVHERGTCAVDQQRSKIAACSKSRRFWLDQIDRVSYT